MITEFFFNAAELAINKKWLRQGVLNKAYRDLKRMLADDIRDEGAETVLGDVQVTIEFAGSQADIDAPIKATLDILQKAKVFRNDKQVRRLVVEITDRDAAAWYAIEVVPYTSTETADEG